MSKQHDLADLYKVGVCLLSGRSSVFKSLVLEIPIAYLNQKDERSLSGNVQSRKFCFLLYRGADKSLARPGRKQATTTEDFEFHMSHL